MPPRQLVVERAAIGQAGQGVGAGFGGVGFDQSRLFLEFFLGVFQLSFHLLVGRQQFRHGGNDGRRFAVVVGRQLLVDFLDAAAVLADVRGDPHRQVVELRHRFVRAALLRASSPARHGAIRPRSHQPANRPHIAIRKPKIASINMTDMIVNGRRRLFPHAGTGRARRVVSQAPPAA